MPRIYDFHMRFQITGLRACVLAFLASKGFLTSVGKHAIFQSAWRPAREAALIAGKGFLSKMLQHAFLDIISLDAWIVALVTTETPLSWMSVHMSFECPCGGIFALFATMRLFARVDLHVDSKPASLIARVVALWTTKGFSPLWARMWAFKMESLVLSSRTDCNCNFSLHQVGSGRLRPSWKILIYDLRIQQCVLKAPVNWYRLKEQVDLARSNPWKVKMARYDDNDDDDDDDDDRNIYLRNEYL